MKNQTLVIGLDGATFDVALPLIETGHLPNLAHLKAEGTWGNLRSVMHPESAQAWSSFLTGTNPGRHGIFGFTRRAVDSYNWLVNTSNNRVGPDIAEVLAQQGKQAGLFNVPLTYPPHPADGFVVSGMGTPSLDSDFIYPAELKEELLKAFGEDVWVEENTLNKTPSEYLRALHRSIDRTLQLGKFLLQRFPTLDLYVFVFMASDRVQHFYWNYVDRQYPDYVADAPQELKGAISAVYEHLDQAVGELTSGREDWNIMVMSDHGGGPFYRMVNLNRWLEKEGYLRFLDASSATKDKQTVRLCYLRSAYRFFHQHIASALSHRQKDTLRKLVPQAVMSKLRGYRHNPMLSKIDWSRTQAYAQGAYGRIFLNIAGREPQGIVSFEKRKELLDEISAKLLTLRDPLADETVVEHVYRREELFQGPFVDHAPDLLIVWRGWRYHTKDTFANDVAIFSNPPYWRSGKLRHTGNHRIDGLLLIQGEMVNKHCEIKGAEIVDLAPTLLYLLGATIPDTMDGKVLIQAVEPGIRLRYPPRYGTLGEASRSEGEDYTDREEIAVRERLRGLGYVD